MLSVLIILSWNTLDLTFYLFPYAGLSSTRHRCGWGCTGLYQPAAAGLHDGSSEKDHAWRGWGIHSSPWNFASKAAALRHTGTVKTFLHLLCVCGIHTESGIWFIDWFIDWFVILLAAQRGPSRSCTCAHIRMWRTFLILIWALVTEGVLQHDQQGAAAVDADKLGTLFPDFQQQGCVQQHSAFF